MQTNTKNPWINAFCEKPILLEPKNKDDVLTSKEIFFSLQHRGGIYHGWYIARPIENAKCRCDCDCCDNFDEDDDLEYEYFFNANVGDELFEEDLISFWMYKPNLPDEKYEDEE